MVLGDLEGFLLPCASGTAYGMHMLLGHHYWSVAHRDGAVMG